MARPILLLCIHFCNDALSGWVRIPEQHSYLTMTADQCYLGDREAHFEKTADGLVSQVMKVQVGYARTTRKTNPSQAETVRGDRKKSITIHRVTTKDFDGLR
jgi:hypothetical protein